MSMDEKWKCSVCDTYNQASDTECFVCGKPKAGSSAGGYTGGEGHRAVPGREAAVGIFKKIGLKLKELFNVDAGTGTTGPVDVRTSDDSSRDAYVEAIPSPGPTPILPRPTVAPAEVTAPPVRRDTAEVAEPWPEHRIRFCTDKFAAMRCTKIVRSELSGVRGYEMHLTDGSKRFINVNNLKMMGLAVNA